MAAQKYYYSDSITDFLSRSNNEIVGALTLASQHDVNDETSKSWVEEIETIREVELLLNENMLSLYKHLSPLPYSIEEEGRLPMAAESTADY